MIAKRNRRLTISTLILIFLSLNASASAGEGFRGARDLWGPRYEDAPQARDATRKRPRPGLSMIRRWNEIALDANARDHVPVAPDGPEQLGPLRTARAFAIVHIAIFDAVNAIAGGYRSYTGLASAPSGTSMDAAVAQAAHDTLVKLYRSQRVDFDKFLDEDLSRIGNGLAKTNGIVLGGGAAAAILALRAKDGSAHPEPPYDDIGGYIPNQALGKWRQDPISKIPLALGAYWSDMVAPFVLQLADQFPAAPPPALGSAKFARAFNEVKRLGGCGNDAAACATDTGFLTATARTPEQTTIGIYWGYDGTPGLGTPPRLYNQIAVKDCRANALGYRRACAPVGAHKRRDGRCRPHELGDQVRR